MAAAADHGGWGSPLEVEAGLSAAHQRNGHGLLDRSDPRSDGVLGSAHRVPSILHRRPVQAALAGGMLLLLVSTFFLGRESADVACPGGGAAASELPDTVAPEGRVSASFGTTHDYRGRPRALAAARGAVAADHGRCSDIGLAALRDGGSAVDAAVATALCQGVMNPSASGLGGGHIMLVRAPNGSAEVIDAREVAPAAATESMFAADDLLSLVGGLAAGVPLELKGLWLAHQRHGRLPWPRLLAPTIAVAEAGFPAHPYLVAALAGADQERVFAAHPALQATFYVRGRGGRWRPPRVNETCCARPRLAALLREVSSRGPDALYAGRHAEGLVADVAAAGGAITLDDLARAAPAVRAPLRARAFGLDLLGAPPPSSSAAVLAALLVLDGYEAPLAGAAALGQHRLVEAMKHAFALRASLGDPGPAPGGGAPYVDLAPLLADMLSPGFAASLRAATRDDGVLPAAGYGGRWNVTAAGALPDDHGTTHISVVAPDGGAVALTSTVNTGFGSKVLSTSTGLLLNNQMDDFSTPGRPNVYGIPASPSNYIRPGRRPQSSMSPLIAERGGRLAAVLGGSGGPRIVSAVLQVLLRLVAYGEDALAAVAGARLHHQLLPPALFAEDWAAGGAAFRFSNATLAALAARGHAVRRTDWGAVVQAVVAAEGGGLVAVSDPRKDGAPAGF